MPYLRNTRDSIRIYESYPIKDALKENGYIFDGRGFWHKLTKNINTTAEYTFLTAQGVDLLLPQGVTLQDLDLIGLTSSEIAEIAANNPREGMKKLASWSKINSWFNGPKRVPAIETVFVI